MKKKNNENGADKHSVPCKHNKYACNCSCVNIDVIFVILSGVDTILNSFNNVTFSREINF